MRSVNILIAGAGPCGLGAALELMESGPGGDNDFLMVDPRLQPGGWASSQTTPEGFTFDYGGHVLFPHKKYARFATLLQGLPIAWAASVPQRGVQVQGNFLPYPAQRNLQRLPLLTLLHALASVMRHRAARKGDIRPQANHEEGDMRAYLLSRFGPYVTALVMEPLNRKQWAHPIETLTDVWVAHRSGSNKPNVVDMDLVKIVRNLLLNRDDPGWTDQTRVTYPAFGGSGAIWSAVSSRIPPEKLLLGTSISSLCLENKTATLSSGETVHWQQLVSTMPLDTLVRMLANECPVLDGKAERFVRARSRLFGFGIRGKLPVRYVGLHSCQVTDADVPFWRLNFPMTVSPGNGPEGCYSLLCEVSEPASQPPAADLRAQVQTQLYRMGLLGRAGLQLVSSMEATVEHGYPVPFLGRDKLLREVQPVLEAADVYSRGRFGSWRYEISNQDHAFMQGVEVVRRILFDLHEETFGNAGTVNGVVLARDPQNTTHLGKGLDPAQEAAL
jgi:protoporphyrinogen oxidase